MKKTLLQYSKLNDRSKQVYIYIIIIKNYYIFLNKKVLVNQPKLEFCNNIKIFKQKNTINNQEEESQTPKNFCFSTREKASSRRGLSSGCLFAFPRYHKNKNALEERDNGDRIQDKLSSTPCKNKIALNKKF